MSTIKFSNEEIVNMYAASWAYGSTGSSEGKRHMQQMAEGATAVLSANLEAFRATYPGEPCDTLSPVTAKQIDTAMMQQAFSGYKNNQTSAFSTLNSLRYNLIANDGRDFATPEVLDELLTLAMNMLRRRSL